MLEWWSGGIRDEDGFFCPQITQIDADSEKKGFDRTLMERIVTTDFRISRMEMSLFYPCHLAYPWFNSEANDSDEKDRPQAPRRPRNEGKGRMGGRGQMGRIRTRTLADYLVEAPRECAYGRFTLRIMGGKRRSSSGSGP